ncbi:HAMP domain-containing histidine kinase [Oscillospiraceae bacterium CM]|nr:HAMP domain-containing histidine kinase [Oscillospiraceae bacterium CM]
MKRSLRTQLSLSYAIMALLLVAVISVMINYLFQNQFKNYVISQQQQKNQSLVNLLENQYQTSNNTWDITTIQNVGMEALEQGIILKVRDGNGNMIWDATVHNSGMCVQMLQDIAANMQRYNANFKGGYVQNDYQVVVGSQVVGSMTAGYFGPYYFTDNDIYFLQNINRILIIAAVFALVTALALATYMARRISRPLSKAVSTAREIAKGNYSERIEEKHGTREIVQLTETVNNLADSLEKQQGLRKQMSADVAHELRTPLATLQSSLEAMIDGVWQPDQKRLMSCHEEILRINRLVGDLEKLERLEAENSVLNYSEFDLTKLIAQIVANFEPEYRKNNISLSFSGDTVSICADKDKLSQVVINLISNALKYTLDGGAVDVQLEDSGKYIKLSVSDTGVGIPAEDIPFIFERFYRADKSRTRLTGGLGLGLTISKAIIDAHNGRISVSSDVGKGTKLTVFLPKK